jgi:hypothetical protein
MNDTTPEDTILPEQFLHEGASRCRTAEHRLMLAVLWDAAYVYGTRKGRRRGARLLREIEEWLRSSDTSYIFSFESICDTLGLDPDYVRGGLRVWRERSRRTRRPNVRQSSRTKGVSG